MSAPPDRDHTPRIVALSIALYRLLLHLYPAPHRRQFGTPMDSAVEDRCRLVYRRGGVPGLLRWWACLLVDLVRTLPLDYIDALNHAILPVDGRDKVQDAIALVGRTSFLMGLFGALLLPCALLLEGALRSDSVFLQGLTAVVASLVLLGCLAMMVQLGARVYDLGKAVRARGR